MVIGTDCINNSTTIRSRPWQPRYFYPPASAGGYVAHSCARRFIYCFKLLLQTCTVQFLILRSNLVLNFLNHCTIFLLLIPWCFFSAWVYFRPCRSSRCPDRKCMLGIVLSGTWYPAWWSDAQWQDHWWRWWLLQHILQWNRSREACAQSCLCWFGAYCYW